MREAERAVVGELQVACGWRQSWLQPARRQTASSDRGECVGGGEEGGLGCAGAQCTGHTHTLSHTHNFTHTLTHLCSLSLSPHRVRAEASTQLETGRIVELTSELAGLHSAKARAEGACERAAEAATELRKELALSRSEAGSLAAKASDLTAALAERTGEVMALGAQVRSVAGQQAELEAQVGAAEGDLLLEAAASGGGGEVRTYKSVVYRNKYL